MSLYCGRYELDKNMNIQMERLNFGDGSVFCIPYCIKQGAYNSMADGRRVWAMTLLEIFLHFESAGAG